MRESIGGLEDVIKCLQHEPDDSMESRTANLAEASLTQAREVLRMVLAIE